MIAMYKRKYTVSVTKAAHFHPGYWTGRRFPGASSASKIICGQIGTFSINDKTVTLVVLGGALS
ncbi:hypothetical protein RWE15_05590 [Virgibacillus halophilus]|uniref:Uncharacterized protein n=1 Tax=Tigheibacillus halophilus TaxID=361280 RepID=A0ABU5C656_9BACI|nr:hypothetical protein [Virgibacillus halophilus]